VMMPNPPREEEWRAVQLFLSRTASCYPRTPHGKSAKRILAEMEIFDKVAPSAEAQLDAFKHRRP
jgi:hypothetical protein